MRKQISGSVLKQLYSLTDRNSAHTYENLGACHRASSYCDQVHHDNVKSTHDLLLSGTPAVQGG